MNCILNEHAQKHLACTNMQVISDLLTKKLNKRLIYSHHYPYFCTFFILPFGYAGLLN